MLDVRNPYARRYASLSIADLLDAREAAHIHFTQMENVFATAIGLYRSLGFFAFGVRARYYRDHEDALEMMLVFGPTGEIERRPDEVCAAP